MSNFGKLDGSQLLCFVAQPTGDTGLTGVRSVWRLYETGENHNIFKQ
jgi:hypothetical protein